MPSMTSLVAPPSFVPAGRFVELPDRGTTFIREAAGPPGAPTVVLLHGLSPPAVSTGCGASSRCPSGTA